jgi:hypothetical protein
MDYPKAEGDYYTTATKAQITETVNGVLPGSNVYLKGGFQAEPTIDWHAAADGATECGGQPIATASWFAFGGAQVPG